MKKYTTTRAIVTVVAIIEMDVIIFSQSAQTVDSLEPLILLVFPLGLMALSLLFIRLTSALSSRIFIGGKTSGAVQNLKKQTIC